MSSLRILSLLPPLLLLVSTACADGPEPSAALPTVAIVPTATTPPATPTAPPSPTPVASVESAAATAKNLTVFVSTERSTGSGVSLGRGQVITNAHVVGNARAARVRFPSGRLESARVVRTDTNRDLALLLTESDEPGGKFVTSRNQPLGSTLVAAGFPGVALRFGEEVTVTQGILSSRRLFDNGVWHIQTDTAINPGNSGGPVLNMAGDIVALSVSGFRNAQGVNFAVAGEEVLEFLQDYLVAGPTPQPPTPSSATSPRLPSRLAAAVAKVESLGYRVRAPETTDLSFPLLVVTGVGTGPEGAYDQRAFFFVNDTYLGTDTLHPSRGLSLAWRTGDTVALSYALYGPTDPPCCPSGSALVRYRWTGSRLMPLDPIPENR